MRDRCYLELDHTVEEMIHCIHHLISISSAAVERRREKTSFGGSGGGENNSIRVL
jgi:hypothetical protein